MHLQAEDENKSNSNGSSAKQQQQQQQQQQRPGHVFYGHNRQEVTRVLIQSLTDLGYQSTAEQLSRESGYELEAPSVASFRTAVQNGEWAEAEALLSGSEGSPGLALCEGARSDDMVFLMRQQKYLELLEVRHLTKALMVLRQELTPLHQDVARLHALSSLIMCRSADDLRLQAQWDGAKGESRRLLLSQLSSMQSSLSIHTCLFPTI
jgi:hypothetical protein